MLSYQVTYNNCSECFRPTALLSRMDEAIATIGKRMYETKIYLLRRNLSRRKLRTLLYYKEVLSNLIYNTAYYEQFKYEDIESRIKVLINGL